MKGSDPTAPARGPRCATCRREVAWHGKPHRPFCSLTCRLIDLGVWLDEGYRLHANPPEALHAEPTDVR